MVKKRYLYKIFPVRCKSVFKGYDGFETIIIGFWGWIFKLIGHKYKMGIYVYTGNYFKGLYWKHKLYNALKKDHRNSLNIELISVK